MDEVNSLWPAKAVVILLLGTCTFSPAFAGMWPSTDGQVGRYGACTISHYIGAKHHAGGIIPREFWQRRDCDPLYLDFFTPCASVYSHHGAKGNTFHGFGWPKKKRHSYPLRAKWHGFHIDYSDQGPITDAYDIHPGKPCTILATNWGCDAGYGRKVALSAFKGIFDWEDAHSVHGLCKKHKFWMDPLETNQVINPVPIPSAVLLAIYGFGTAAGIKTLRRRLKPGKTEN